ncbi:hypothetical protein [Oceanidesulfovibrio indonesiensis]|uniref:hypothetical protein n=1 Tax=Oceanidesulfovibrio indonesiensis TaxID=54767 RepID=UPI0027BAE526|nr:hypothetical protein [Oceanidesulfovibrio indonesiensis]
MIRDLGLAVGAALVSIYILLVLQTNSFSMPLLLMTAIPLTLLAIMPGFWANKRLLPFEHWRVHE